MRIAIVLEEIGVYNRCLCESSKKELDSAVHTVRSVTKRMNTICRLGF